MKQISATISIELHSSIQEIADREERSFSAMVSLLLLQAVKERERNRKKHNAKKGNIEDQPADTR